MNDPQFISLRHLWFYAINFLALFMHMCEGVLQVKGFINGLIMIGAIVVEFLQQSHGDLAGTTSGVGGDHSHNHINTSSPSRHVSLILIHSRGNESLDPTQVPITSFIRYAGNRVKPSS